MDYLEDEPNIIRAQPTTPPGGWCVGVNGIRPNSAAGGQTLQSLGYTYDTAGNLTGMVDAVMGQTHTYAYDALDRLTGATVSGSAPGLYSESYSYDTATGNLQNKGGVGYTYGDPNHKHAVTSLSNGNSYQYDANGNMTARHVYENGQFCDYTLAYDAENRMAAVSGAATASYVYNGDGARVIATVNGATTIHVGAWYEYNLSTGQATKYYYAGSQRIAMQRGSDPLTWLLGDHLGSTSVAYVSGGSAARQGYKAWGETRFGGVGSEYQYTGQYNQQALGLYFYNARWYDSSLGRWAQPDTIVPGHQGVQAWDRYAGMNNNPIRWADPSGHGVDCGIGDNCKYTIDNYSHSKSTSFYSQLRKNSKLQYLPNADTTQTYKIPTATSILQIPLLPIHSTLSPPHFHTTPKSTATPGPSPTPIPSITPTNVQPSYRSQSASPISKGIGFGLSGGYPFQYYGVAGLDFIYFPDGSIGVFTYSGSGGETSGGGLSGAVYLTWSNAENPQEYQGFSTATGLTASLLKYGITTGYFQSPGGNTGGIMIGYAPGAQLAVFHYDVGYILFWCYP